MLPELLIELGESFAVAIVLACGQSALVLWMGPRWPRSGKVVSGLLFGLMAVIAMNLPIVVSPGVQLDLRNLMIFLAGPFGGPVAAVVAGALGAGYRLYLGGGGTLAGVGSILTAAALGAYVGWRFGRLASWRAAALGGTALFVTTMPWFLAIDDIAFGWTLLQRFAPAYAIFYLAGTVLLSTILMAEIRRHSAEASTRFNERRFRDVAEMASDWFWEMDADLRVTYVSERLGEITGFGVDFFQGKRRRDLIADVPRLALQAHEKKIRQRVPFRDFSYTIRTRDGSFRQVLTSGKPVFDDAGQFCGYRGSGRDVTAEAYHRQELETARRAAEVANRSKSDFVATMSHELRTPLTSILGFSEILEREIFGPHSVAAYGDYVKHIRSSSLQLLNLANEVFDLSTVEARHMGLERKPCDLAKIAGAAVGLVEERARSADVRLVVNAMPGMPLAKVDERALKQVVFNLLANAVKFTGRGGGVEVTMAFIAGDGHHIVVSDSGVGIAEEDLDRVFRPFRGSGNATGPSREGSGLGLPLSKALVEAHGGSLTLTSRPGEGTRVRVTLPGEGVPALPVPEDATGGRLAKAG